MTSNFEDLPFDNNFYQTFNDSSWDNNVYYYNNRTDSERMDIVYTVAESLKGIESIITLCGLLLNLVFAFHLICVMLLNRGNRALVPRLWLAFGILVAHMVFLIFLPIEMMIMYIAMEMSNKPLCIFISSIFESSDFASILTTTVLSCNVYWTLRAPRSAASRKATLVWIFAGFAAWIVGFGISFAIGAAVIEMNQGHCGGPYRPLYLGVIRFIISFLVPYTLSIALTILTIIRWRKLGYEDITQIQLYENRGVGQVLELPGQDVMETSTTNMPGIVGTGNPLKDNAENLSIPGAYKGAEKSNKTVNLPGASEAMEAAAKPTDLRPTSADNDQLHKKSLKFWVIFNAVNVFLGFLCRLCISLPLNDLLIDWEPLVIYYMVMHMLLVLYFVCFPFLCLITTEVRNIRKTCFKIFCWCCNCCLDTDED